LRVAEAGGWELSTTLDQALAAIRAEMIRVLPPDWYRAGLEWAEVGGTAYELDFYSDGFDPRDESARRFPPTFTPLMRDVRAALAEETGQWAIALTVNIAEYAETASLTPNFDHRLVIGPDDRAAGVYDAFSDEEVRPSAQEWKRELELHPRDPSDIPDWWKAIVETGSAAVVPEMPQWFDGPMPQSIEDAERGTRDASPGNELILTHPGYKELVEPLRPAIFDAARRRSPQELDALFGRDGKAAQLDVQRAIASDAVRDSNAVASLSDEDVYNLIFMYRQRVKRPRPERDEPGLREEAVEAAELLARIMVAGRFGQLPLTWYKA